MEFINGNISEKQDWDKKWYMVKKPNLFIVGAPKCGTSFLYKNLSEHPQVFMCPEKEPNYFDKDLDYNSSRLSLEKYLSLFEKAGSEKIIGEASPWYLYSSVAAKEICQFSPDAKIIIMLRSPVEMMYSLFLEHIFQGNEVEEDFEKAVSLEEFRRSNKDFVPFSNPAQGIYYKEIVSYYKQVDRYFKIFKRENVLVILFDDLKRNPRNVLDITLKFLNIDTNFEGNLSVVNSSKRNKNKRLKNFVVKPPRFFRNAVRLLIPIHSIRIFIQKKIVLLNTKQIQKGNIDQKFSDRLNNELTLDIKKLGRLINRDLSNWLK